MRDDELAAVIAALNVYFRQQPAQTTEPASKWKLAARREAVSFDELRMTDVR